MQQTKNLHVNALVTELDSFMLKQCPQLMRWEQPGYRTINYGLTHAMQDVVCYIICYDQKANLGFPHGATMVNLFQSLKGTGKHHRHVEINDHLMNDLKTLQTLIETALAVAHDLNKK